MSRNNRVCVSSLRVDSALLVAAILCIVTQHSSHIAWRHRERLRRRLRETKTRFTCHGANFNRLTNLTGHFIHKETFHMFAQSWRTRLHFYFFQWCLLLLSANTQSRVVRRFRQLWRSHRAEQKWPYHLNNWRRWWRYSHSFWKARRLNFPTVQW